MAWQDKTTVKKGNIGEDLIREFVVGMGYVPYSPESEGKHPFDKLCASNDKKYLFIAEAKTKPARVYYPDTGIDMRHYDDYKNIQKQYNIPVFIFFVDEDRGEVYGNFLDELDKPRTINHNGKTLYYPHNGECKNGDYIRYFPLEAMIHVGYLSEDTTKKLKSLSTRNDKYNNHTGTTHAR